MNRIKIDKKIIKVTDILEQIQELNLIIAYHKKETKDEGMRLQYEFRKSEFVEELKILLQDFQLQSDIRSLAA